MYYSCDCTVSREEAAKLLARCEEFVIKPSIDTGSGKGVKLVKMGDVVDKFSFTSNLIDVYSIDNKKYKCSIKVPSDKGKLISVDNRVDEVNVVTNTGVYVISKKDLAKC